MIKKIANNLTHLLLSIITDSMWSILYLLKLLNGKFGLIINNSLSFITKLLFKNDEIKYPIVKYMSNYGQ